MRRLSVAAAAVVIAAAVAAPTVTLAAWQDTERTGAEFTAGTFQSQSQTAGSPEWATHAPGDAAVLVAGGLTDLAPGGTAEAPAPGEPRYVWLNLRTASGSHWSGHLHLSGTSATGDLVPALEYRMMHRTASTADCTAADMSGVTDWWQPAGSPLQGDLGLTVPADAAGAVGLCFEVRMVAGAPSDLQGATADLTWTFSVVQDD